MTAAEEIEAALTAMFDVGIDPVTRHCVDRVSVPAFVEAVVDECNARGFQMLLVSSAVRAWRRPRREVPSCVPGDMLKVAADGWDLIVVEASPDVVCGIPEMLKAHIACGGPVIAVRPSRIEN